MGEPEFRGRVSPPTPPAQPPEECCLCRTSGTPLRQYRSLDVYVCNDCHDRLVSLPQPNVPTRKG